MAEPTAVQHRTSALVRPGRAKRRRGLLGRALEPFFGRAMVEQTAIDTLRAAHERGVVVHTLRSSRWVDPLYIQYLMEQLELPIPSWFHDHYLHEGRADSDSLIEAVGARRSAVLFLRQPQTLFSPGSAYREKYVEALLELQRSSERPILLIPEVLIWTRRAAELERGVIDNVFGDREAPGRYRELLGYLVHFRNCRYHVGAPIDLQDALQREEGQPTHVIAKKVRWLILNHLSREEQIRTGPVHRGAARTRQAVLNDPHVRRVVQGIAEKKGQSVQQVQTKAEGMLRTIAADIRYGWLRVLDTLIDLLWHRIYDGIVVDRAGFAKLRDAARRGPVVVVPSHKSHVDYMVLSQVFFKEGMIPPHIAAGENLNFWPMGTVFRRAGAFFIRRSFGGDKLYTAVFSAYVRRLLRDGHVIEFFIEGGRSRTGRLLPPRMGMLSMCLDPVFDGHMADVRIVPVSISYEKVVEARSYARELAGGAKKKENVTQLLSSGPKVLASRYGRVYVDFAEPISVAEFAEDRGMALSDLLVEEAAPERKQLTTQLGHRVVYGINEVTRVTPTAIVALVLLSETRSGVAQNELTRSASRFLELLEAAGARVSPALRDDARPDALREAIGRFVGDGLVRTAAAPDGELVHQFAPQGRQALDFYKNGIVHFLVPAAIVACASLVEGAKGDVRGRSRRLSQILKAEVSFRVDANFDANFDDARTFLHREGVMGDVEEARVLGGLIAVVFETYRLVAESLVELQEQPMGQRDFIQRMLVRAQKQVLEGRISRPEGAIQPALANGLQWMLEAGVVARVSSGLEIADEEARRALVDELSGYLTVLSASSSST